MSTIDEIMAQANRYALRNAQYCAAHITNTDLVSGEVAALRHLITQAIAEARADGAREMRDAADALREDADEIFPPTDRGRQASVEVRDVVEWYSESIRALPMPTGGRQAVLLEDEQMDSLRLQTGYAAGMERFSIIAHDIEGAVLAANGLEVRRG